MQLFSPERQWRRNRLAQHQAVMRGKLEKSRKINQAKNICTKSFKCSSIMKDLNQCIPQTNTFRKHLILQQNAQKPVITNQMQKTTQTTILIKAYLHQDARSLRRRERNFVHEVGDVPGIKKNEWDTRTKIPAVSSRIIHLFQPVMSSNETCKA